MKGVWKGFCYVVGFCLLSSFSTVQHILHNTASPLVVLADTAPPASDKLLFYVYRSTNNNVIVYELNTDKEGNVRPEDPVHVYWLRNTEGGTTAELSYIQRKFAYGLHHHPIENDKQSWKLNFVSYAKRELILKKSPQDKKYHVYLAAGKKQLQVQKIFIKVEGGSFWFPNVPYIEVTGKDAATGELVKERFKP